MTALEIVRSIALAAGILLIAFQVWRIARRLREINKRIEEVRAEEDEIAKNPYAAYARMLEAQELLDRASGKSKASSPGKDH